MNIAFSRNCRTQNIFQVNSSTERRILFSIWSPFKTDDPKSVPADQRVQLIKKGKNVTTGFSLVKIGFNGLVGLMRDHGSPIGQNWCRANPKLSILLGGATATALQKAIARRFLVEEAEVLASTCKAKFLKMGHSWPLFLYFRLFIQTVNNRLLLIKFGRWMDSNPGPLVRPRCQLCQNHCPIWKHSLHVWLLGRAVVYLLRLMSFVANVANLVHEGILFWLKNSLLHTQYLKYIMANFNPKCWF